MLEFAKDSYNKLCAPARFYLIFSSFAFFFMIIQNLNNDELFCLGELGCYTENSIYILLFKIVYIIFWTWLLNIICRGGGTLFSWILVLLPFILFFILLLLILFK